MRIFNILKNDYIRLFIKRESRVVLGKNNSTLWLLSVVLAVTFLAISFSNASLNYLSHKMEDPFINWVDIKNEYGEGNFIGLEYALDSDENKATYHYRDYQYDFYNTWMFFGRNSSNIQYLKCRFFEDLNIPLVEAILSEDNVIKDWRISDLSALDENSIGMILTHEAMKKLGYDEAPAYINLMMHHLSSSDGYGVSAAEYGFEVYDGFVEVPFPVLAVVDRLPGNVDLISTAYLNQQRWNDIVHPFNLAVHPEYADNLSYFITDNIDIKEFSKVVNLIANEIAGVKLDVDDKSFWTPEIINFRKGRFVVLDCYDEIDYEQWAAINKRIIEKFGDMNVYRVYAYEFCTYNLSTKAYLSVHFEDLDKLRDFENYVRDEFNVKIDMSQINAKENFNSVSTMGNILSALIIVFAIVCIILFIVNLLQSYFQKIKRNLGTFKAFGISNHDLISVYVLIMVGIVVAAIFISVSTTWLIQIVMHVCGVLKDGAFDYLSLWSAKTICSIVVIVVAAVVTVHRVMKRLLKATPGDLIYDRQ